MGKKTGPAHSEAIGDPTKKPDAASDAHPMQRWAWIFWLPVLLLIAVRFAEPVGDGDLFWQMAYGKYMLANHTLIPDHTIYSWTPSSNNYIYCAWLAEILFYGLYLLGGLPLIFAFRYLVVIATVLMAWSFARKLKWHNRPEFILMMTIFVLSSYVGSIIKPELFSLFFMNLMAWLMFSFRLAARRGQAYTPYLVAMPLAMVAWANTHGVHPFGVVALGCFTAGELLNQWLMPDLAIPRKAFYGLMAAAVLTGLAILLTPYGWHYPYQSLDELFGISKGTQSKGDQAAYNSIAAHMTIWQTLAFHFHEYLIMMVAAWFAINVLRLLSPAPGRAGADFIYLLLNLLFGFIYNWYLRTTFYWPPFFVYSTLYMLSLQEESKDGDNPYRFQFPVAIVAGLLSLFLCLRGVYEAVFTPYSSSWCGFGITYWNPVLEAEFVNKYHPDAKILYNDYDGGGYLIWRFYPDRKVMIDPRSFPYRNWYAEYIQFERAQLPESWLDRFPEKPEVAIVSLKNSNLWRTFLHSPNWQEAWVGQSSVVFCRRGHRYPDDARNFHPERFDNVENVQKCLQIYQFYIEARLYDDANHIVEVMKRKFHTPDDQKLTNNLECYQKSMMAFQKGDINEALRLQEECRHIGLFYNNQLLLGLYQYKVQGLLKAGKLATDPEVSDLMTRAEKASQGLDPLR